MNSARPLIFFVIVLTAIASAQAADAGSSYEGVFLGLSDTETAALDRGELIVRPLDDSGRLSLARNDDAAKEILTRVKAIRPNYTAEFMAVVPVKDAAKTKSTLNQIAAALADVRGYMNIPYWSKQQKKTYALFDKMEVLNRKPRGPGKGETIEVRQHMEPFDEFRARYDYWIEADTLRFSAVNEEDIVYTYRNFRAVSPGNMLWELYVFPQEGRLYVYGLGAVKAFDMLGIFRSRLEPSLMGRVEAFFAYVAKKTTQQ